MPAQSAVGETQLASSSSIVHSKIPFARSFSFSSKFSPKQKIMAAICVAAVVTAAGFGGYYIYKLKTAPKKTVFTPPPINVAEIKYPSNFQRDIFLKNFQDAQKETDNTKRYQLLLADLQKLQGFYAANHDPKIREVAETYARYMISNYPEKYAQNKLQFTIPCYDPSCGKANVPTDISNIKNDINGISIFGVSALSDINSSFEAASFSNNDNDRFNNYMNAYSRIKGEYQRTKDPKVKEVALKLIDFLKNNYSNNFDILNKDIPEAFKLN